MHAVFIVDRTDEIIYIYYVQVQWSDVFVPTKKYNIL